MIALVKSNALTFSVKLLIVMTNVPATVSEALTRKYKIILAIATTNEPTLEDIIALADIPKSTVTRQIRKLRDDFAMDIQFEENKSDKGRTGYYHIFDWGVFDKNEILIRFAYLLENK